MLLAVRNLLPPGLLVAMTLCLPELATAEIIARQLGTDAEGQPVVGYVYQAGTSRGTPRSQSSHWRSGLRVRSSFFRHPPGVGPRLHSGAAALRPHPVSARLDERGAPVTMAGGGRRPVSYGVRFTRAAGRSLAPMAVRGIDVGGRFFFKIGF